MKEQQIDKKAYDYAMRTLPSDAVKREYDEVRDAFTDGARWTLNKRKNVHSLVSNETKCNIVACTVFFIGAYELCIGFFCDLVSVMWFGLSIIVVGLLVFFIGLFNIIRYSDESLYCE